MKNFKNLKAFESFNATQQAYAIINESITDFMAKEQPQETDLKELDKVEQEVLSNYDLPQQDIENIKNKIADAISRKMGTEK